MKINVYYISQAPQGSVAEGRAQSFFFIINFYWSIVALQLCVCFLLYSKVSQSYVYVYILFF